MNNETINILLKKLEKYKPFVYHRTPNSVYIHFRNLPNKLTHKLRFANHPERTKYGYKWQLRTDEMAEDEIKKKYSRYFRYPSTLVFAFIAYYNAVEKR